jgi:hypothetical protein
MSESTQTESTQAELVSGSQYTNITETEFDDFMDDVAVFNKHVPAQSKEVAYDIPTPNSDLVIRVFSTIVRGNSRAKGKDAIRLVVYDKAEGRPVGGRKKTLRLAPTESNPEGWKGNLRPKIIDLIKNWREYDRHCPECGHRMTVRQPDRGDDWDAFWGCEAYPDCKHSESMD